MTVQCKVVEPVGYVCEENTPSADTTTNSDIHVTASLENQRESANRDQLKNHPSILKGSKCTESHREIEFEHTQRQQVKSAERSTAAAQRDIISTKSNRDLMRQISGLGMVDPVYGTREASPLHQSMIYDDMSFSDIPEDFKDAISVASDHTATDGNGFDSAFFSASLQFNPDEHDLPSLDGSSVSKNTKKQSRNGNTLETLSIDFDSLLSGNGRLSQIKAFDIRRKDLKPPHPPTPKIVPRAKPRDISVKPRSSQDAYREIPTSVESMFTKQMIHSSSPNSDPTSSCKAVPLKTQTSIKSSSHRSLPTIAQLFSDGRPPRGTKDTKTTDYQNKTTGSQSSRNFQKKGSQQGH